MIISPKSSFVSAWPRARTNTSPFFDLIEPAGKSNDEDRMAKAISSKVNWYLRKVCSLTSMRNSKSLAPTTVAEEIPGISIISSRTSKAYDLNCFSGTSPERETKIACIFMSSWQIVGFSTCSGKDMIRLSLHPSST